MAPHNLNPHQESEDHRQSSSSSSSNIPSSSQQQQYNYDYNYESNYHPDPNQYQYQPQMEETIHSIPLNNQKDPVDAEIRFTGDGNEMVAGYLGNHTVENAQLPREEPEDVASYPDQEEAVWNADFGGKATRNTLSTPMHLLEPNGALLAEERGGEDRPEIYQITFLDKRSGKNSNSTSNPSKMPSERDAVSLSSDKIAKLAKGIQPSSSPPTSSSKAEEEEKRLQQLNSPPVPPPTLKELMDSKPHRDSYFIPSKGIWLLLSESEDFLSSEHQQQIINYKIATSSSNQNDPTKSNFLPYDLMNSEVPVYEKDVQCVRENEQKDRIVNYQPMISNQDMNHYFGENDRPTELSGKVEEESGAAKTFLWNVEGGEMPNPINSYNPYIVNFNIFTNLNTRSTGSSYGMTDYERLLKQKVLYSSGTSTTPTTTTSSSTTSTPADRITSLVPVQLFEKLCARRTAYPLLGELGSTSSKAALRTLIRIVAGAALGNTMAIPLSSKTIKTKLGIDKYSMVILKLFGFSCGTLEDGRECILPPPIKIKPNDEGDADSAKINSRNKNWRTRLIRGWIEMETWYKWKFNEQASEDQIDNPFQLKIQNALPELERKVGYNKRDQQVGLDLAKPDARHIMEAYDILGCAFDASFEVLTTAYKSNKIRNPHRSRLLFGAFDVVYMEHRIRNNSSKLKPLYDSEGASKNFTQIELTEAYYDLGGNGRRNGIGLTNSEILNNFDALIASHSDERDKCGDLIRQLEILSAIRGNPERLEARLKTVRKDYGFSGWGHEGSLTTVSENFVKFFDEKMSKEEALKTFNIDSGVEIDEETLLAIYELISMDSPEMKFKYDKALKVLAEDRQSRFLLNFLETGNKEDTLMNGADDNKPTGINNIGNTCFLNSVLQYFFILIEVRNRVLAAEALWEAEGVLKNDQVDSERSEAGKGNGQKEEGRRVGGRVVTEKEVVRSRRFVKYLAQLFNAMISSPFPAVTPERELAYLALVSSRAEEDVNLISASKDQDTEMTNQNDKAGLFSENSNGTDTTLVEEPLQISEPRRQVSSNVPDQKLPSNEAQPSPLPNGIDEDVEMGSPSQNPNNEGKFESNKENIPYVSNMDITDQAQVQNSTIPKLQHALPPKPDFPYEEAVSNTQNSLMQLGAQQDVSECLENVMFQLEVALGARSEESKGGDDEEGEGEDLLPRLFRGRTAQRVQLANSESVSSSSSSPSKPQAGASVHVKREIFKVLPVEVVEEGNDLYDSLDGFFDEETLIGETGKPVIRNVTLVDPPPVLQIQLQRVQYDRVKGLFKSQAHLDVKEKIYLDRYLDFDLEDKERSEKRRQSRIKRKEINALREKIKDLKPSNHSTIPATLNTASNYLLKLQKMELPPLPEVTSSGFDASNENLDHITSTPLQLEPHSSLQLLGDSAFSSFVSDYSKVLETEISGYETRISALKSEVEGLWSEEKRVEYQLVSVFMHRGEASHGHYWICQRQFPEADATQESSWFKYNDSVVTRISRNEVLRDTTGATPYLLCFVRSDLQSNSQTALIETIKREIEAGIPQDATIPTETDPNDPFYPQPIPPPPNSETETGNMTYELD